MVQNGVPLSRLRLLIRTLHPQLFAMAYTWLADTGKIEKTRLPHEVLGRRDYMESPFALILESAGGVRRKLEGTSPLLDYPILKELHEQGCTDYVAMPMLFSDGQINIFTLVSKQTGGFSTDDLGHLYEILPAMSRLFELHAQRRIAISLLDTYLGKHSGRRVLDGVIKRGDGESINAVIWYCDLRDSTSLTETMPSEGYLTYLNQFFDCMAGAVLDHEGEVLKFIGDAVLAIFPVTDYSNPEACENAVAAARDAQRRIESINRENMDQDIPPIKFGLGIHLGNLTYGNIGTTGRLDFTVIGAAANEVARIEGESKRLGEPVLISAEFAKNFPGELKSLGTHSLRGISVAQEIFTLFRK
jgi:adenylate cyclase